MTIKPEEDDDDQYKLPSKVRRQAKEDAKKGLEIKVAPLELIEQIDKADKALNGDSNDDEHDALWEIREWIAAVLENGRRE